MISARVHPGEPNSSWMMKGMIDYLTGPSTGAQVLRKHFLFKIVPMLNPDGVINGNTRVNLAGWDLNRKWSYPVEKLFPTVFHLKRQIANLQARDRVAIYCDLHGHSLNRNIFTYGCYTKKSSKRAAAAFASMGMVTSSSSINLGSGSLGNSNTQTANFISRVSVRNDPRVFPMIVAKNSHFFSFASCDFKVHKSKLNTARVVVNHELGVINSYTLEASFCGPDFGPRKDTQFSTRDLEDMGKSWCQSLLIYFDLVADVKALDAQREQELALMLRNQKQVVGPDGKLVVSTTTTTVEMTSSLLSDCEAAISELFANTEVEYDDDAADVVSMDSDLSGAEDEPIPPNQQANGGGVNSGGSDAFLFNRIPSEAGGDVTAAVGGDDDVVECYSSAPEDGDEHQSPEKTDGGSRRRKSRNSRKKIVKKSGSSGKRSKAKSKKDKAKAKDKASTGDHGAVVTLADEDPSAPVEPFTGKKKASKLRRKSKSGSKKGRSRSQSIHGGSGVKQKPHAGSGDDSECDGDEAEEVDDEDDDLMTLPLTSARVCPSDGLVLPSMPGSADRRRLKHALMSANGNHTLRHDGGKADEVDDAIEDQLAPDDRRFLCPTPPSQRGRAKFIRTASPPPIELPVLRGSEAPPRRGSFKVKIMEAYGLTGRHGNGGGYADNSDSGESEVGEGKREEDSDASGPEAYLSEF